MTRTEAEKLASVVFVCFGINQLEWTPGNRDEFDWFVTWVENHPTMSAAAIVQEFARRHPQWIARARAELEPHG